MNIGHKGAGTHNPPAHNMTVAEKVRQPAHGMHMRDMINMMKDKGLLQKPQSMKLGGGGRFAALESKLSKRPGVTNPGALAAYIGRKRYGKAKFQKLAAKGK